MNVGDEIIYNAVLEELNFILEQANVRKIPSRTIAFPRYQQKIDKNVEYTKNADYIFLSGTNLLKSCMLHRLNQWNINIFNYMPLQGTILVGVGSEIGRIYLDKYTRMLYGKVLNKNFFHSVRDEQTKIMMNDLGLKALNTGCPTLWSLDEDFCKSIPTKKSKNVVFTLHYGRKDKVSDQYLIDIVNKLYEQVYFFPQTPYDVDYLLEMKNISKINILPSNLNAYKNLLEKSDLEYVGIRLHGGIFAMKKHKRSIIIMVDDRMRNIYDSNRLNCIDREEIQELESLILSEIYTNVKLDYTSINEWKQQFNR